MIPRKMYRRTWSQRALMILIASFLISVLLSLTDGFTVPAILAAPHNQNLLVMRTLMADFRFLAEQAMYASTILFVGAKFFEQRTVITVAFDRPDAGKMAVMGQDENGFIWVGRKYQSMIEAERAVTTLKSRIMQATEKNIGDFGW